VSRDEAALPGIVGRYEVRAKIGRGAFGTVYRAYDPQLDREVALKLLHDEALASRQAVERFQREARTAARMHHPHIVPVHDFGRHDGRTFIVSALIPGRTLASGIPDDGMDPARAVRLTLQLVEALAYAHDQGVLHRDVKPGNIMVAEPDVLYLMDFGLAGWTQQVSTRITHFGAVLGTPSYMAPEQARGDLPQLGPAADVYSSGVVFYEMLTGRVPFEGPLEAVVYAVLHTLPDPPSRHRPGLDPALEAMCLKAIAKAPEQRYAGARDMAEALKGWLREEGQTAPRPVSPSAPRRPPALPTMVGALPAGAPEVAVQETVAQAPDEKAPTPAHLWASVVASPLPAQTGGRGPARQPGDSADDPSRDENTQQAQGDALATRPGWQAVSMNRLGGQARAALSALRYWCRRRPWLAFVVAGLLVVAPATVLAVNRVNAARQRAAEARRLEEAQLAAEMAEEQRQQQEAAEAGRQQQEEERIAAEAAREQFERDRQQAAATEEQQRQLSESARLRRELARVAAPSLLLEPSPVVTIFRGESTFLKLRLRRQGYLEEIRFQVHGLPELVQVAKPVVLAPVRESVPIELVAKDAPLTETEVTVSAQFDGAQAKATVRLQVKDRLLLTIKGDTQRNNSVAFSPDGKRIASGSSNGTIKVWDANKGSETLTLKGHGSEVMSVAFSADGKRILSGYFDGTMKVWDVDNSTETLTLKSDVGRVNSAAFSPDGKRILGGSPEGLVKVWDTDKDGKTRSLWELTSRVNSVAFDRDGKRVVGGCRDGTVKVWDAVTGRVLRSLKGHRGEVNSVAFSPDGKQIVSGSADETVKVWDADEEKETLTLKAGVRPKGVFWLPVTSVAFSPDGTRIVSCSEDKMVKVWHTGTGNLEFALEGHKWRVDSAEFSPDGKRIVSSGRALDSKRQSFGEVKVWDAQPVYRAND
jgi:WD40 repeat protein/serine/threonine protein kinase